MTTANHRFRHVAQQAAKGLVLGPVLTSYLSLANFPDVFQVTFRKAGMARKPDGWFHPSTHPLMEARQLFYYLTKPELWVPEELGYESRMSVTMGTATHGFFEMCLLDAKVLVPPKGTCLSCGREHGPRKNQCGEHGVIDKATGSRGHLDGILNINRPGVNWKPGLGVFEFKSGNPKALLGAVDNDLEWLMRRYPGYYAQLQEYMRLSGLRQGILLFLGLGYPWKPIEFQVPYDHEAAAAVERKYLSVRQAVAESLSPDACCSVRSAMSKVCPARVACPVGRGLL